MSIPAPRPKLAADRLWRVTPLGALAHPVVCGLMVLVTFIVGARFRWGVPWVWHFVAALVLLAVLQGVGRVATALALRRDPSGARRLGDRSPVG